MGSFPQVSPTKTLCVPLTSSMRSTCTAHLILLDFITRTILGEQYRSLSSSLYNFLHSPVTPTSQAQIFSSTPYSEIPSAYAGVIILKFENAGWDDLDWIHQGIWRLSKTDELLWTRHWTYMFHKTRRISRLTEGLLACHEGLCLMQSVGQSVTRAEFWNLQFLLKYKQ